MHDNSAVDKPKFMGRPPDHPWWKTWLPESFLGCPNYFDLALKEICFLVINAQFACFLFHYVPIYRELGRPSGDFGGVRGVGGVVGVWGGHVGSPNRVMGLIWRLGNLLSTSLMIWVFHKGGMSENTNTFWCFLKQIHRWSLHVMSINSLWPRDAVWRHRSGSTLAQVMAWCLIAPSHYLNQCWPVNPSVQQICPTG